MKIHYKNDSLIDEKCKYLDIPKKERKILVDMLNNFDFDDAIEINIVKHGTILNEMKKDPRIRKDLVYEELDDYACGKKITKEELMDSFKDSKICYCAYGSNINKTIVTVFHELNHFYNPFELSELTKKLKNSPNNQKILLELVVKNALNEFASCKKLVEQLANYDDLKKTLISECKERINQTSYKLLLAITKSSSEKNRISLFFKYGFNDFFRYLGCWKGFQEINETEINEGWDSFMSFYYLDFIDPQIFTSLKSTISTFNGNYKGIFKEFINFFKILQKNLIKKS